MIVIRFGEIVGVMISGGSVEVEKRGEMRGSGSNGVEYGGMGSINGQILKRGPAGSGRVNFINRATIPRRRSIAHATPRSGVRRVCPNFKNDRNTYLV